MYGLTASIIVLTIMCNGTKLPVHLYHKKLSHLFTISIIKNADHEL